MGNAIALRGDLPIVSNQTRVHTEGQRQPHDVGSQPAGSGMLTAPMRGAEPLSKPTIHRSYSRRPGRRGAATRRATHLTAVAELYVRRVVGTPATLCSTNLTALTAAVTRSTASQA